MYRQISMFVVFKRFFKGNGCLALLQRLICSAMDGGFLYLRIDSSMRTLCCVFMLC